MIPVLSRAQMRRYDGHAIHTCRVPSLVLMENAGRGAADTVERELFAGSVAGISVVVVCGPGNNGGDGFVVARHLLARGARVSAWLVGDVAKTTPDCRANHDAFVGLGGDVRILPHGASLEPLSAALAKGDLAVDALFGTGLDRPIVEPLASVVRLLNAARAHDSLGRLQVVALDVPSGIDADTGVSMGIAVDADLTVSFAHLKLGHVTGHGSRKCGPVHVVDIGVPRRFAGTPIPETSAELVESRDVRARIQPRPVDTHKYRAGHVAVFAGSSGTVGAAMLAARGALRGGAGAATIVTWPDAASALEARTVEVMVARLTDDLEAEALRRSIDASLSHKRAVVIGPGFGTSEPAKDVSRHVLATFGGPIVADADMFTLHAGSPEDFAVASGRAILTPHGGELGRLLGKSSEEVEADRFASAREAAKRANATVLLKGAYTVVASPTGRVVVVGAGSPALATAGSGDILSGIIGALSCTLPPFDAAWCGAFLHGTAGRAWEKEHGDRGLLASEIADGVPGVLAALLTNE